MSLLATSLQVILLIVIVLTIFNVIIFVHELGHFLAAKWRGLKIDRFQIWFGTPIWKKEINGVQFGLGWIPAGGFVALPQMAPMDALEGGTLNEKPLPPISPLDKIIVAFAGPLFSMILALIAAFVVWGVGKPADFRPSNEIGFLLPGSPAEKSGLQLGDKILAINGSPVNGFQGTLDSISERIVLSRGEQITYTVERPGVPEPLTLKSGFEKDKTAWYQRGGLRRVGILPSGSMIVGAVSPKSPADDVGMKVGDRLLSIDGVKLYSLPQFSQYLRDHDFRTVRVSIESTDKTIRDVDLTPERPLQPANSDPKVGFAIDGSGDVDFKIVYPQPLDQVKDSLKSMWITVSSVIAPDSSIGVSHLSGPVGIAKMQYQLLQTDNGWRRILSFMVLFNVNLAVLNMMPFPVLDGGHITLAILEKIFRRPVKAKPLEILQTACAMALIGLMLFVTSKDIGDSFGQSEPKSVEVIFP
jgi:regulator of sigma E protease